MIGRIIAAFGVLFHFVVCVWLCNAVATHGHSELIGPLVLAFLGLIVAWLGLCAIIGTAFSHDIGQGLCCLFLPLYIVYFGLNHCRGGLALWLIGTVLWVAVRFTALATPADGNLADQASNALAPWKQTEKLVSNNPLPDRRVPATPQVRIPRLRPFPTPAEATPDAQGPSESAAEPRWLSSAAEQRAEPAAPFSRSDAVSSKPQPLEPIKPRPTPKTFPDYVAKNFADWIGDDARLTSGMRWLPIAKRPALAVRWGVGITMGSMTVRKTIRSVGELSMITGPVGPEIVRALVQRLDEKRDGAWSDVPDARLTKVPVFSAESEDQLIDEAARQNLDGLVLMSLSTQRVGLTKTPRVTLIVRLVDVLARKTTWSSAPLNNQKARATLGTAEDASVALAQSMIAKLDEEYGLTALPAMTEVVVKQHASNLSQAAAKPGAVLRTLAELRYYQAAKLLQRDDAQRCYQALIGDKAAAIVAGPDSEARACAVEGWFLAQMGREPGGLGGLR